MKRNQITWVNDPIKDVLRPLGRDKDCEKRKCVVQFCKCHGGTLCSPNNKK